MKVQLEKTFALPASADAAWTLLRDMERVAGCMPGARITERLDDSRYKGTIAVKFGPASMSFRGEVTVLALEPASRTLRLAGKGTDTTGSSGASMDLTARIEPVDASSSRLLGSSEVTMSGKAAAFGARMMSSVADQVLKQFGDNFGVQLQAQQAQAPAASGQAAAAPMPAPPPSPSQLNGLALAWAVIKEWLRSLFTAKRA
jgi:carbon monoxide dehydrogenase subunit G